MTFDELVAAITQHFQNGDYAQALALADEHAPRFPQHAAHMAYLQMCLAARLEQRPRLFAILQAMHQQGIWYSEEILRNSPSFKAIQNDPIFESLIAESNNLRTQEAKAAPAILVTYPQGKCQSADETCPLLLALHANGESPESALAGWHTAAQEGWLVAAPRSSHTLWAGGGNMWFDHQESAVEIITQIEHLAENYWVDGEGMLLGGFSMGAEVALWMALKGLLPAHGFILLAPGGPLMDDPDQWLPLIQTAADRELRGYILFSEEDPTIPHAGIRKTAALLNQHGIPTHLEVLHGLAHEYPPDFEHHLRLALDFIGE